MNRMVGAREFLDRSIAVDSPRGGEGAGHTWSMPGVAEEEMQSISWPRRLAARSFF